MVREEYSVSLKSIVEEQGLTVLHAAKDFDSARSACSSLAALRAHISRPWETRRAWPRSSASCALISRP